MCGNTSARTCEIGERWSLEPGKTCEHFRHVSEWFQNSIQESNLKFLFHEETMAHAAKWLHELIFCASINNFCQPTLWQTLENHGKSRWNEWSTMNSNHFPAGRPCGIRLPRFASASPSISISCRCALKGSRLSGFSTDDAFTASDATGGPTLRPCPSSLSAHDALGGKTHNSALAGNCHRRNGCKNGRKPQMTRLKAWDGLSQLSVFVQFAEESGCSVT